MKLKRNNRCLYDIWRKRRFAFLPVQLGQYDAYGLRKAYRKIWWEYYWVDYQLNTGYLGQYNQVLRKYQNEDK